MRRRVMIWSTITSLMFLEGCNRRPAGLSTVEPYLPDDASVVFKLKPEKTGDGSQQWTGTYESKEKTARFRIEFGPARASGTAATEFNIRSGEGRFIPEPESDSSILPPGNWTLIKLILGEGDQEGELFLNINPNTGTGQFSMKDADYGDLVLAELAKVL